MNNTLAQERSKSALDEIKNLKDERDKFAKLVSGLPAMILQNGFGQSLAFLLAKKKQEHLQAFNIVVRWLESRGILKSSNKEEVVISLSNLPQESYLHAQEEALKYLEWIKRYANAELFVK
jgi:CRISPR-associated protein Cmr5